MATDKIVNLDELSPQGYWKPANSISAVSPDNVTHAQLRYSPSFDSNSAVQGTVISGENSTFVFSIADADSAKLFKLYTSTDGTTYTVNKKFGGDDGVKLFGTTDTSGLVTLTTAQNISGTKTINGSANLVIASGSDITVQSGGDITLADAPTASTDAANKAYVDARASKEALIFVSSYDPTGGTIVSATIYNTTGRTFTLSNVSGGILISFTGSATSSLFFQTFNAVDDFDANVGFSYQSGFDQSSPYTSLLAFFDSAAFSGSVMKNFSILIKDYS